MRAPGRHAFIVVEVAILLEEVGVVGFVFFYRVEVGKLFVVSAKDVVCECAVVVSIHILSIDSNGFSEIDNTFLHQLGPLVFMLRLIGHGTVAYAGNTVREEAVGHGLHVFCKEGVGVFPVGIAGDDLVAT